MYPNVLPPFGHASQIGFLLVEPFERRNVAQSPHRRAVLEPGSEMGSLAPEILGKAAVVQYGHTRSRSRLLSDSATPLC
jgi:hypothetical protein